MAKGLIFWMMMILWFVFWLLAIKPSATPANPVVFYAGDVLLFVLLFLLGWAVFGFVVQ